MSLTFLELVAAMIHTKMQHGIKTAEYHSYSATPVFSVTTEIGILLSDYN